MRKTILCMLIAVLLGSICGNIIYKKYDTSKKIAKDYQEVYFLEEGVYNSKESLTNNTKDLNPKLVINKDNKYYVYVGITKDLYNASKIKKLYNKQGYKIYNKIKKVSNKQFIDNVNQFDMLMMNANNSDIFTIEKVILSNYEELIS